jgi:hypothetical protein
MVMNNHDLNESLLGANSPQGEDIQQINQSQWSKDIADTLALGQQFSTYIGGVIELARAEALLALRTLPKLIMLWLIMMPVLLLTWCAFSMLLAWSVYAASAQVGLGMLVFFLLQLFLLLSCRWLFVQYRTRMTLPNTSAQIQDFIRSVQYEFSESNKPEK